ncbi:helix-turn-helix transcriptional regulator [Streptomyces sp. UNOC14_S4]|uniref:helix-turn-helix transcriptional regulator n=1 Tax=Streptomyces sp. UNOC14_S4 TaxID=2872340 RepID=UPI001E45617D|nr:helix-turn-helix transcriptional regulator [Streptomyces sp. UNOC14_S4]MCC3770724.1 helix-turn-helix transcriptional regulator [Streptomyces sp. UNOC14_S4]
MRNSVRKLRSSRGLSQGQLGAALGVSRQTVNAIETERYTPSLPLAMAMAKFFEVSVEEMFHADGGSADDE